jgi:hypothetical protein
MLSALLARIAPYRTLAALAVVGGPTLPVYIQHLRLTAEQAISAGRLARYASR